MKHKDHKLLYISIVSVIVCSLLAIVVMAFLDGNIIRALLAMLFAWITMFVVFVVVVVVSWMFGYSVFED